MCLQKGGVEATGAEVRLLHDPLQERDRRLDPTQDIFFERAVHAADRFIPCAAPHDEFGEKPIVIGRDGVVLVHGAVNADPDAARGEIGRDRPSARPEVVSRVLGIDPALDGVPLQGHVLLPDFKRLAGRDRDLGPHDVYRGDLLGDRVLHLDARVHLDEVIMSLRIEEEFHGARVVVIHGPRDGNGRLAHLRAQPRGQNQRRGDLDQLLVATLDRAVAFTQMDHVAVAVRQDLELNMVRTVDVFLDKQAAIAERREGLAGGRFHVGR
jgi:hypothetical protein